MHILVTRPEPDASEMRDRLAGMGHTADVAPLLQISLTPPPAAALMSKGNPMAAAFSTNSSTSSVGITEGATATPFASAKSRAEILSPISAMVFASGPMKVMPASATADANAAFSDRKP